jgi:hypothetical protein
MRRLKKIQYLDPAVWRAGVPWPASSSPPTCRWKALTIPNDHAVIDSSFCGMIILGLSRCARQKPQQPSFLHTGPVFRV